MKKIAAWMLWLALLLGCAAAVAETAPKEYTRELTVPNRFTVKWVAPEDYELTGIQAGDPEWIGDPGFMIAALVPNDVDSGKPMVNISIAMNEMYTDVARLNDLDEESLAQIEETFRDEDTVDISYMETAHGTKLMVVKEANDGADYVDFYTIYMGYEIEMVLTRIEAMDKTPLTDEEIAMVVQFLSDLEFIPLADENTAIQCSIENGSYIIRIPAAEDDLGWYADETGQASAVKLAGTKMENGCFVVQYDPVSDGEATVTVRHFYCAIACNQAHTWYLTVQDGAVQEVKGGSYTALPAEEEVDPYLSGEWLEKDTQFTQMTIAKNEAMGWDVEIVSPMTHGAYKFIATLYQDCYQSAFLYDKGKMWTLPVNDTDDTDLGEPAVVGATGSFQFEVGENGLCLVWVNDEAPGEKTIFERAAK